MAASINADNGVVSGSAGLKPSADSTGVLALQTNGTTAVSISTAQVVSLTSGLAVTGALSATGTGTLRDLITTTGALIQGTSIFRVESTAAALPAGTLAGLGLEMYASSGTQKLSVYNRTTNLAGPLDLLGSTFNFNAILDISNASAGQIKFPATPNASANANTLDDYEEGTWPPVIRGSGTAGTYQQTVTRALYTKVGRQVTLQCYITMASTVTGGGTGYLQITGAPFTAFSPNQFPNTVLATDMAKSVTTLYVTATWANTTIISFQENQPTTLLDFPIANAVANKTLLFTMTYFTD